MPRHSGFRLFASLCSPLAWSVLILSLAGELGSPQNTLFLTYWFLSWFILPSPETLDNFNFILRKSSHLLFYGILFILWCRACQRHLTGPRSRATWAGVGICLVIALLDEGWQSEAFRRHASVGDILLDLTGVGLAALLTRKAWQTPSPGPPPEERRMRLV